MLREANSRPPPSTAGGTPEKLQSHIAGIKLGDGVADSKPQPLLATRTVENTKWLPRCHLRGTPAVRKCLRIFGSRQFGVSRRYAHPAKSRWRMDVINRGAPVVDAPMKTRIAAVALALRMIGRGREILHLPGAVAKTVAGLLLSVRNFRPSGSRVLVSFPADEPLTSRHNGSDG